jgi:hypothetical protein
MRAKMDVNKLMFALGLVLLVFWIAGAVPWTP